MELTYRYRLYPTQKQEEEIRRTCSAVRFLYNRLLEDRTNAYRESGKWIKLTTRKYQELAWMAKIDSAALQAAENQLETAFKHFFYIIRTKPDTYRPEALLKAKADPTYRLMDTDLIGYPKFKKKKTTAESYQTNPSKIRMETNTVVLPFIGRVRAKLHRPLPDGAEILKCSVLKKKSGRYHLLLLLKVPDIQSEKPYTRPMGIVFSPGQLALRSDGVPIEFHHMDSALKAKIEKAYKTLKRRTPGSHRYEKQREYLAKLYEKRVEQRRDQLHKAARQIANDADVLCMEAPEILARTPLLQRENLYDTVHDEAWWKFSRMLEQKMTADGRYFWRISRHSAFLGMCSVCDHVQEPVLAGEEFHCPKCGAKVGREENALKTLEREAKRFIKQLSQS